MVGSLDPKKVKGKIVVCLLGMNDRIQKGPVVKNTGGVGMALANDGFILVINGPALNLFLFLLAE